MDTTEINSCSSRCRYSKNFGSGTTTLVISNEKINDIMETAKSPVESGLLIIIVSETNKNETKEQKDRFFWYFIRCQMCKFIEKF